MSRKPPLYHLTHPDNVQSILQEGIRANEDGEIFVFTDWFVADTIAANQVFLGEYAVFRIYRKRISFDLLPDEVAEFSAPYQRIIKMDLIPPRCLQLESNKVKTHTIYDPPTMWEVHVARCLGRCKNFNEAYQLALERKQAIRKAFEENEQELQIAV